MGRCVADFEVQIRCTVGGVQLFLDYEQRSTTVTLKPVPPSPSPPPPPPYEYDSPYNYE